MTDTYIPTRDPGMASGQTESFGRIELFSGDADVITTEETVDAAVIASADLPQYSVVGRDASGNLVLAVHHATPASAIQPIGITTATVKAGATAKNVAVFRGGCFNPAALNWDASYTTDALKRLAFEANQPGIVIRKIPTYGV